jgi:MATE family multidrug resistance protein
LPLAAALFDLMGGSDGVTRAAKTYFTIRIWSAPFALANYVILGWLVGQARANPALLLQVIINLVNMVATILLVLVYDTGIAGAAIAALLSEAIGFALGVIVCRRHASGGFAVPRATLLDRAKLMRLLAVNSDILIRTAALIAVFLFFTAKGARSGDVTLAANSVLNNFLLVSAFFLDGLANAAQQLCGRTFGARDAKGFSDSTRLVLLWGLGFAIVVAVLFAVFGPALIDFMTASEAVRRSAREFLPFVVLAPIPGVFAFGFDGIYIGATWAREMRNLMLAALAIFLVTWWALQSLGNAGLWWALIASYVARGGLQGARYPAQFRATFPKP